MSYRAPRAFPAVGTGTRYGPPPHHNAPSC
jgi:hypothetical protein